MQPTDRAAINRANAQHSTGPRTDAGKKRSSLNAMRHGLTGQTVFMPGEDMDAYTAFCNLTSSELKPVGFLEQQAAQTIADATWRLNRARAFESHLYARYYNHFSDDAELEPADAPPELTQELCRLGTYEGRLNRSLLETKKELAELQKVRKAEEASTLEAAINLRRHTLHEKTDWQPSDNGFVFTIPELDGHLRLLTRQERANYWARCNPLSFLKAS